MDSLIMMTALSLISVIELICCFIILFTINKDLEIKTKYVPVTLIQSTKILISLIVTAEFIMEHNVLASILLFIIAFVLSVICIIIDIGIIKNITKVRTI